MAASKRGRPPATNIEDRENQLISLATDLAEERLMNGTASNQLIVHYLKLGSTRERLEKEKLIEENKLLRAKTDAVREEHNKDDLYKQAIEAMRSYSGKFSTEEEIIDD